MHEPIEEVEIDALNGLLDIQKHIEHMTVEIKQGFKHVCNMLDENEDLYVSKHKSIRSMDKSVDLISLSTGKNPQSLMLVLETPNKKEDESASMQRSTH